MQGTVSKYRVALKRKQRRWLDRVIRRRTPSHWLVLRAKVILLAAEHKSIQTICLMLSIDRQVVRRWCKRFSEGGVHALGDRPRSGRPPVIEPKVWQKVATVVVQPPTKFDLELPRWSLREPSLFLNKRFGWKVSRSSLSRFLRSMALKPHRIKYWLNPTDPDFDEKAAAICKLYLDPPPRTVLLSVDEKPGVQARSRKHPTIPMAPGRPARVEFEYKRHGTRNVFAAFNVRTGHVLVEVTADRKLPRVIAFLNLICATYHRGRIVIITPGRDPTPRRGSRVTHACLLSSPRSTAAGSTRSRSGSAS
jgi:transposase